MTHSQSAQNPQSDTARKTTTPQHLPMPHPSQKDTHQQDTPLMKKQQAVQEKLSQWKKQRHNQQQRIAAATATGMQLNNWTKAQWQCMAAFRSYHKMWLSCRSRNTELATAAHFRLTSASMALYLFTIHPALFKIATAALAAKGKQGPKPLTSIHACTATNPKFVTSLRHTLGNHQICVELNSLGGASCYNPPTNFSLLPSSGPPSTQPAVLLPQPISTAPAPAPPAQPAPLAFNPFHTSYLPLYNVTDFYKHPQGYAQL